MLATLQADVRAVEPATVVLVEGLSDVAALEALAPRCGWDPDDPHTVVFPMGGATNIRRHLMEFGPAGRGLRLLGLCDAGEAGLWWRALGDAGLLPPRDRSRPIDRAALADRGFFVCDPDLEHELIRAHGWARVEAVVEEAGELASLRRLQLQPFHRGGEPEAHLHRFLGSHSGRKFRYARLLVEALDDGAVPAPLADLAARMVARRGGHVPGSPRPAHPRDRQRHPREVGEEHDREGESAR